MAQTLPNGVVVPNADGGEPISETGVQEMRTLGASVDNALVSKADTAYVDSRISEARYDQGRIPNGSDVLTLRSGSWTVSSMTNAETMTNLPELYPGKLIIDNGGEPLVKSATYRPYNRAYIYEVQTSTGGEWMPWRKTPPDVHPGIGGVAPYAQHSFRQTQLLAAMGGPVLTGGLGAVAWRIDHGLKNFRDIMLPIFRAAGIVPMITYNPRDWSRPENEGVTAADLNQWVANGWVEISNHAANHTSATGNEDIYDQIVNGLAEIEAELPAARGKVFGFCVAGSGGYTDDAGETFTNGATPEQWGSHAGRLILEHHAVGYGYLPGTDLRVLDGTPRDGLSHLGTDTRPVSEFTAKIDQAIAERKGLQIMSHPSNLGNAGYHDAASIQQIVDYIVAKRDAGELAVLSSYQMMVADSTRASASGPSDTDWIDVIPSGPAVDPAEPGVVQFRRVGDQVFCRVVGVAILPGASNAWLLPNGIPSGYRLGGVGQVTDVPGGYGNGALQPNRAVRHRLSIQEDDIGYVGYIHNWNGTAVEAARADGSRRIYGTLPSWITDDPFPA